MPTLIFAFQWSDPTSVAGLVVVIGVVTANVVTIIKTFDSLQSLHRKADNNAVETHSAASSAAVAVSNSVVADERLQHIDEKVNGNLTRVQEELARQVARSDSLQEMLRQLMSTATIVSPPVRVEITPILPRPPDDSNSGGRRSDDVKSG